MRALLICLIFLAPLPAAAAELLVAVATNFLPCAERLAGEFARQTGHDVRLSSGSTGKLAAQIEAGAPYDAFLAADQVRPERLDAAGLTVPGSRFTYALGRLALWSAEPGRIDGPEALKRPFRRLAIANPDLAPYGAAAMEALRALGLSESLSDRLVRGENVGQALAMIVTGNAEMGFVALAGLPAEGSRWLVPEGLHAPIRQDAVLLNGSAAAAELFAYLESGDGRAAIQACGYGLP